MSRKRRPDPTRKRVALVAVSLLAVAAGWWLLSPRPAHQRVPIAAATSVPVETALPTMQPTSTPASEPSVVPTPSAPAPTAAAASPEIAPPGAAQLALIVDDCGQWLDTERAFVAMPIPLTLSVLPDVRYTQTIAREAARAGKGVMLHLPMETVSGLNPGPGNVTTKMTDAQIEAQVRNDLAQVPLARGVNNHEGSKASADVRVMRDVAQTIAAQGHLFFIDSRTSPASVAQRVASQYGIPSASRDVFLDDDSNVAAIEQQLRVAASIALRKGRAIAIGHPRPSTLEAVRALAPQLQAEGVQFVLVQNIVSEDP
jgi:polysaccharide deacetylase 2 family uncharacterized protein YibQ